MGWHLGLAFVLILTTGVFFACDGNSGASEPTLRAAKPLPTARTTLEPTAAPTPVPEPTAASTPTMEPTAAPTPVPEPTATSTPTMEPTIASTPTPKSTATSRPSERPYVIRVEFPDWIEESPNQAETIAASAVIAKAHLVSIESAVVPLDDDLGYEAELIYQFEAIEYLEGNGHEVLAISLWSGPRYASFPDVLDYRTEGEARELAERWKWQSLDRWANIDHGVLFAAESHRGGYSFASTDDDEVHLPYPAIGETWLSENTSRKLGGYGIGSLSAEDLADHIEDIRQLTNGPYERCMNGAIWNMTEVRERIEGTYRQLTVGGWLEPEPLPRRVVELSAEDLAYPQYYDSNLVLRNDRFPPNTSRFSHYWLDGRDKDLFAIDIYERDDTGEIVERLLFIGEPSAGEYTVHFNQYHTTLPCDAPVRDWSPENWWHWEAVEWVVKVQ